MNIYVELEDYLAQWFINDHGGGEPVKLTRGSVESKILEVYLAPLPAGAAPDLPGPGDVAILIPTFRAKPATTYNHLPKHARAALLNVIRERFDIQLWQDLHVFGKISKRQDELIYAWMEKHGIEMTDKNWNAIAKRYQRQREVYLSRDRAKCSYSRSKSH